MPSPTLAHQLLLPTLLHFRQQQSARGSNDAGLVAFLRANRGAGWIDPAAPGAPTDAIGAEAAAVRRWLVDAGYLAEKSREPWSYILPAGERALWRVTGPRGGLAAAALPDDLLTAEPMLSRAVRPEPDVLLTDVERAFLVVNLLTCNFPRWAGAFGNAATRLLGDGAMTPADLRRTLDGLVRLRVLRTAMVDRRQAWRLEGTRERWATTRWADALRECLEAARPLAPAPRMTPAPSDASLFPPSEVPEPPMPTVPTSSQNSFFDQPVATPAALTEAPAPLTAAPRVEAVAATSTATLADAPAVPIDATDARGRHNTRLKVRFLDPACPTYRDIARRLLEAAGGPLSTEELAARATAAGLLDLSALQKPGSAFYFWFYRNEGVGEHVEREFWRDKKLIGLRDASPAAATPDATPSMAPSAPEAATATMTGSEDAEAAIGGGAIGGGAIGGTAIATAGGPRELSAILAAARALEATLRHEIATTAAVTTPETLTALAARLGRVVAFVANVAAAEAEAARIAGAFEGELAALAA